MNKNNILAIILVFILISVIKIIGIENIPFPVTVVILVLCMIVAWVSVLKYEGSKKERTYLLVITILVTLFLSVIVIAVVIEKSFPQISEQYKPIFIVLIAILFLSLLIVIFANAIYKYNKGDKS